MRDAANGKLRPIYIPPAFDGWKAALDGFVAFILINLLGLAIVGALKVSLSSKRASSPRNFQRRRCDYPIRPPVSQDGRAALGSTAFAYQCC